MAYGQIDNDFDKVDNFYIAEALNALRTAIPVPTHKKNEFDEVDNYYIWLELYLLGSLGGVAVYGQLFSVIPQAIPFGNAILWDNRQFDSGLVNGVGNTQFGVAVAGTYQIEWVVQFGEDA